MARDEDGILYYGNIRRKLYGINHQKTISCLGIFDLAPEEISGKKDDEENRQKICFMSSNPIETSPDNLNRGSAALMITNAAAYTQFHIRHHCHHSLGTGAQTRGRAVAHARGRRSPRAPRRADARHAARRRSCPSASRRPTLTGWTTSRTGASRASCGGATASLPTSPRPRLRWRRVLTWVSG